MKTLPRNSIAPCGAQWLIIIGKETLAHVTARRAIFFMCLRFNGRVLLILIFMVAALHRQTARGTPTVLNNNLQMRLVMNTGNSSGASSVRIAKNPADSQLYYL